MASLGFDSLFSLDISFALLQSHLFFTLVLPLGILVGSYAGVGNFDNNSGCFTLLLVVVYWWSVHLLPTLGRCVLSFILAPLRSGHSDYTGFFQGHTVHEFPWHHRRLGVMVTYSTHVILLFFFFNLLAVDLPHPLDELIQGTRRLAINLWREVSDHLHQRLPVAEIIGDHYSKKSPSPHIGDSPRLAVTPSLTRYRILGQPGILQRHSTCSNHPRVEPQ